MDLTDEFEAERSRLAALAARILADRAEAEDVVQHAWLRLHAATAGGTTVESLPAWLTTVTTRLCLDRLRARTPVPSEDADVTAEAAEDPGADPAHAVTLAGELREALDLVLDRLPPRERVAFVLHDSFGFDFAVVADVLDTSPVAARKLASRARAKVAAPPAGVSRQAPARPLADWEVVDAFMAAARGGDLDRLLQLLAPDADVAADTDAVSAGTPQRMAGRSEVAGFFNGSAHAALAVFYGDRPGVAWYHRGQARVLFDVTVADGLVQRITFRAAPEALAQVRRRSGGEATA